jgi:hypothetical protein
MNNLRVPRPNVNPVRQPFRPLVRSVEKVEWSNEDNYPLMVIHRGKVSEEYAVVALSTDIGGAAFRLLKCDGSGVSYDLLVNGTESSCTCPGFEYTDGCKHLTAVSMLLKDGSLSVAPGSAASDDYEGGEWTMPEVTTRRKRLYVVRQKGKFDCGIAVVASLAGCTYGEAETVLPAKTHQRGANAQEVRSALMLLTGGVWRICTHKEKPLVHHAFLLPVCAAAICPMRPGDLGHLVILARGKVLDPAEPDLRLTYEEAGRRGYRIEVTIEPA